MALQLANEDCRHVCCSFFSFLKLDACLERSYMFGEMGPSNGMQPLWTARRQIFTQHFIVVSIQLRASEGLACTGMGGSSMMRMHVLCQRVSQLASLIWASWNLEVMSRYLASTSVTAGTLSHEPCMHCSV